MPKHLLLAVVAVIGLPLVAAVAFFTLLQGSDEPHGKPFRLEVVTERTYIVGGSWLDPAPANADRLSPLEAIDRLDPRLGIQPSAIGMVSTLSIRLGLLGGEGRDGSQLIYLVSSDEQIRCPPSSGGGIGPRPTPTPGIAMCNWAVSVDARTGEGILMVTTVSDVICKPQPPMATC